MARSVALVVDVPKSLLPVKLFVSAQRDASVDDPDFDDMQPVGCIARILKLIKLASDSYALILQGERRARAVCLTARDPYMRVQLASFVEEPFNLFATDVLADALRVVAKEMVRLTPELPREASTLVDSIEDPSQLADVVAANFEVDVSEKASLLDEPRLETRMAKVVELVGQQVASLELRERINSAVQSSMGRAQAEYAITQWAGAVSTAQQGSSKDPASVRTSEQIAAVLRGSLDGLSSNDSYVLTQQVSLIEDILSMVMLPAEKRHALDQLKKQLESTKVPLKAPPSNDSPTELTRAPPDTLPTSAEDVVRVAQGRMGVHQREYVLRQQRPAIRSLQRDDLLAPAERSVLAKQEESIRRELRETYRWGYWVPDPKDQIVVAIDEAAIAQGRTDSLNSVLTTLRERPRECLQRMLGVRVLLESPDPRATADWCAKADEINRDLLFFMAEPKVLAENVIRRNGESLTRENLVLFANSRLTGVTGMARAVGVVEAHVVALLSRLLGLRTSFRPLLRDPFWLVPHDSTILVGLVGDLLNPVTRIRLPARGTTIKAGDVLVGCGTAPIDVDHRAPFDARILEVNEELDIFPELATHGYGDTGWILEVEAIDPREHAAVVREFESTRIKAPR
jgi:Lon protease-like protein/glycine cleavage system H lipoate-binding protein